MTERRGAEQAPEEAGLPAERQRAPGEPEPGPTPDPGGQTDPVEESGNESFPASDSPAWGHDDPIPATPAPDERA